MATNPNPPRPVLAITGAGGIGLACARRLARNRVIHIGDISPAAIESAAASLRADGHEVHTHVVDVASLPSVMKFAQSAAASGGPIETIVHTAGLSPVMATPQRILEVDLLGTANVIEAFYEVLPTSGVGTGTGPAMVAISSVARFGVPLGSLSPGLIAHLATSSLDFLSASLVLDSPSSPSESQKPSEIQSEIRRIIFGTTTTTTTKNSQEEPEPTTYHQKTKAYSLSKQANYIRVQASSQRWFQTRSGARINTVSPGIILTAMTRTEETQQLGAVVLQQMIDGTPMRRGGSANEIASAVAFLAGADASFVTGTDLLVDGGFLASSGGGFEIPPPSGGSEGNEEGGMEGKGGE